MNFLKRFLSTLFLLFFFSNLPAQTWPKIEPSRITIARDAWGTPHIFAKTDAEAAYGLAWANCEDHFDVAQELLLAGKMMHGRWKGESGAATDYFVHAIGAVDRVDQDFHLLGDDYLQYLEGYCQGINDYAKAHPKEVHVKKAFPVEPKDVLKSYVAAFSLLTGASGAVEAIVKGRHDIDENGLPLGSNAFALNPTKTTDGRTYLCINPHFQLEGPLSFYEAHISSEEGLNIAGAIFQGGTSVFMGANRDLGWGMTWNYFDAVDTYRLKMHPKKKLMYELDGEWLKLEKRPVWLKVKIGKGKGIILPVKKMTYRSKHGPVLESKNGQFFAVRAPAFFTIRAPEQFYRMNKSKNYDEFYKALEIQGLAKFNIIYADREANIFYIDNGLIPKRNMKYSCDGIMPGEFSDAIWPGCHPISELPQVLNPDCGYVFNTNNHAYRATCEDFEKYPLKLPAYADTRSGDNNRAQRFREIADGQHTFTYDEFIQIKFDDRYSRETRFFKSVEPMFKLDPIQYPDIADILSVLREWDLQADPDSYGATVMEFALSYVFTKKHYGDGAFVTGIEADEALLVEAMRNAKARLMEHYGSVEVPLRKVHLFLKNGKEYETRGFPDVLSASYSPPTKEGGKFYLHYGDSYMQFVAFSKENGAEEIRSLLPYGKSADDPTLESQLDLYNKKAPKSISLDKEAVLKSAVRTYHPGD